MSLQVLSRDFTMEENNAWSVMMKHNHQLDIDEKYIDYTCFNEGKFTVVYEYVGTNYIANAYGCEFKCVRASNSLYWGKYQIKLFKLVRKGMIVWLYKFRSKVDNEIVKCCLWIERNGK